MMQQEHIKHDFMMQIKQMNCPALPFFHLCIDMWTKVYKFEGMEAPHKRAEGSTQGSAHDEKGWESFK